ncbi:MAG TPA: hypothetical protein VM686_01175 [Polyangiaceae bacterium]|nr:hypothetical protein [Polyangiaceae bacterium]
MAASQTLKPIAVGLLIALAGVGYLGCDKDEPPPPLPAAAPPSVAQTPQPVVEVQPEDAGVADAAEDADASKRTGGSPAGLMACCKALEQNAESAPEPNKTHMKNFAATCKMAAGAGQVQGVNLALRMAGLPSCK